jgi:hypothetical protein
MLGLIFWQKRKFTALEELFSFGSFFSTTEVGLFGLRIFFTLNSYVKVLTKNWVGLHFGNFFTKSSGYPTVLLPLSGLCLMLGSRHKAKRHVYPYHVSLEKGYVE